MKKALYFGVALSLTLWLALSLAPTRAQDSTISAGVYRTANTIVAQTNGEISIVTGGQLDIESSGNQYIRSGGTATVEAGGVVTTSGTGELRVASSGNLNVKSGGTLTVESGGVLSLAAGSKFVLSASNVNQNATLTAAESGKVLIVGATSVTVTLPSTASGLHYTFLIANAAVDAVTTNNFSISPAAADAINGFGLTSVDNKDLQLSGNVDREGDTVTIFGDGSDGWYILTAEGTWTKES